MTAKAQTSPLFILLLALCVTTAHSKTIMVNGGSLQAAIDGAQGGDTIVVNGGTYGAISIVGRSFSSSAPLIIKSGTGTPIIEVTSISGGRPIFIQNSSYVAIDGLTTEGGMWGAYGDHWRNIVFVNCTFGNMGQEGIQFYDACSKVDIINCEIFNTGRYNPQWGEGIYCGGKEATAADCYDVWIENCTIHDCGYGEGINIKGNTYRATVRNCEVYSIHPGKLPQYNQAAISADQSQTPGPRDVWIEGNYVHDVHGGETGNHGICCFGAATRIVNNRIDNCAEEAIYLNHYRYQGEPAWVYGNTITNCSGDIKSNGTVELLREDPGSNPHTPQTWYSSEHGGDSLRIVTEKLPAGYKNGRYRTHIVATGGTPPYTWHSDSLPDGLAISGTGVLDGILKAGAGAHTITVTVDDKEGGRAHGTLDLNVSAPDSFNLANAFTFESVAPELDPNNPVEGLWDGDVSGSPEGSPGSQNTDSFVVTFDFGAVHALSSLALFGDADGSWYSTAFTVEGRQKPEDAWQTLAENGDCKVNERIAYSVSSNVRYLRLSVRGNHIDGKVQVREFEAYGSLYQPGVRVRPPARALSDGDGSALQRAFDLKGRALAPHGLPHVPSRANGVYVIDRPGNAKTLIERRENPK